MNELFSRAGLVSLVLNHFSSVNEFLFEKYIDSTGHRYSWYQQNGYSEDADRETRTEICYTVQP